MVFEKIYYLNSRVNPNTSAPKMVPGSYDPVYEEGGQDYPLPHFSWTENRNMGHTSSCWQTEGYLFYCSDPKLNLGSALKWVGGGCYRVVSAIRSRIG